MSGRFPAGGERAPAPPPAPPFFRSMPLPLMILLAAAGIGGAVVTVWLLVAPPARDVPVGERRPPPAAVHTHDVGRLRPAPIPGEVPGAFQPPCPEVAETDVIGGQASVARITAALESLCALAARGEPADVAEAVDGLRGATIRFAAVFGRTGVDSTADRETRTIWLNIKFSLGDVPPSMLAPVIAHEAWHLARGETPLTAEGELAARRVELAVCRAVLPEAEWPRACRDAEELLALGRDRALAALLDAGYLPAGARGD